MINKAETDKFFIHEKTNSSSESNTCCSNWWHQRYRSQQVIVRIIESFYFHALIIFLVIADTSLVITEIILDSFKNQYECQTHTHHALKHYNEMMIKRLAFWMEIVHYLSIGILTFFVIELIVKIYASGREFWNIRRRKMEYFDAFIVITSLCVDLYLLRGEENIFGEKLLLILVFRLWRFIRIISSVTETTLHGQTKHKKHLNQQYLNAVRRLVELLKYKTSYIENNNDNSDSILEHFRTIDSQCQSSLDTLNENHELTSTLLVTQFLEELNRLEDKRSETATISKILVRSSDV